MRRATSCTQVSMMRTQRKKRTVWFVFLFVGAVYASQMAQLRLRAFARNTSCCICSLCPLCSISANAVHLRLSLLVVYRDLPNSDCYRRSIACNGRCPSQQCKHCCLQIVQFAGGVQVWCPQKKKKHEKFVLIFLWCGHRDLNSDGVTIRPSNVRVCLFRHDRLTFAII